MRTSGGWRAVSRACAAGRCLTVWSACAIAGPAKVVETFELREWFGVSHPAQIVEFDLHGRADPTRCCLLDADGREVAFQVLRGSRLAVATDLPAGAVRTWRLVSGRSPQAAGAMRVRQRGGCHEITNGLTGVRVPVAPGQGDRPAAPIQGVLLRDGTWTATGPNALKLAGKLTGASVRFVERGPLVVVVEVSYTVDRPELRYGSTVVAKAGPGRYRCTITLQAGQPSVVVEEDTDTRFACTLWLDKGLGADQARYRGHHARRAEHGREPDGGVYRPWHARKAMDAVFDLRFDRNYLSSYVTSVGTWAAIRRMTRWDPWASDTGWYWQLYRKDAGAGSNLVGIFAGRPSRLIGAAASGAGVTTRAAPAAGPAAVGITVAANHRSADARRFAAMRFGWGLFVGTKADLADPREVQPIARQMNLHGGINLNRIRRYPTDFPDPPGGYGGLYMDRKARQAMLAELREDKAGPHGRGYHGQLYAAEPTSRPLIDMWADTSGDKLREAVDRVHGTARGLLDALVNGDGIYDFHYHYWHGGLAMMRHGVWIDQILADPRTSPEQRRRIKADAALFASVLWDNDFVPLDNPHGLNLGTENMPIQQIGYRRFYALLLASHPTMAARARQVASDVRKTIRAIVNEHGAESACPHYIGASFAPTLTTLLQLKQLGGADPFRAERRLVAFGEFYLNLLTPPEPRLSGKRGFISLGDSSTEPSEMYGMLATGFRDANAALSARLMGAWRACGRPHSGFFGTTLLMIDGRLPDADPNLGDATFPGYLSVLRHGWGTPDETAVWQVNGDHYRDHRHHDHGSVVIYALGAPLSIDWGSLYTPHVAGGYMHSRVVREKTLGFAWDRDAPSLKAGRSWAPSRQEAFVSLPSAAEVRSSFGAKDAAVWRRTVRSMRADPGRPMIWIRDTFAGPGADEPKVSTLNLMATGPVATRAGAIDPPRRTHPAQDHQGTSGQELPSATRPIRLGAGPARFGFTGAHGVDCDVYAIGDGPREALLGNWAVPMWGGHARGNLDRQHILRIRGRGALTTLILPRRRATKGEAKVAVSGENVVVTVGKAVSTIGPSFYGFREGELRVVAFFGARAVQHDGISVQGGPVEVRLDPSGGTVVASGPASRRALRLPGRWRADAPLRQGSDGLVWDYAGPASATLRIRRAK